MTDDNKSSGTQSISSNENVTLQNDIEHQNPSEAGGSEPSPSRRRNIFVALAVLLCIIVGVTITLVVTLGGEDEVERLDMLSASSNAGLVQGVEGGEAAATQHPAILEHFGDVGLRPFSTQVLDGYASMEEFQADLTNALESLAYSYIQWNVDNSNQVAIEDDDATNEAAMAALDAGAAASIASATTTTTASTSSSTTTTKSDTKWVGTNKNQEETADEADGVKIDDKYIYATYGSFILVLDHKGHTITRLNATQESSYIRAIYLTDKHLVVVSDSYDPGYTSYDASFEGLFDRNATHVTVYTKPTNTKPQMKKVGATLRFNGIYQDSRWMQESNSIHLLTQGSLQVSSFWDQLNPQYYPWMSKEDYVRKASTRASKKLIPSLVEALSRDIMTPGKVPNMLKLSSWGNEDQMDVLKVNDPYQLQELLNSYTQIASLSVSDFGSDEQLEPHVSFFLGPMGSPRLYGADDNLVVAMPRSSWGEGGNLTIESTLLVHLRVKDDGRSTSFHSLARLEGLMQSLYSLDVQGTDLRVATTIRKWLPNDLVNVACGQILDVYSMLDEQSCSPQVTYEECAEIVLNCPANKVVKTGCPYTFACDLDGTSPEDNSSTENYVTVFDLEQKGEMREIGRVLIGEPHEIITAIRFGKTFAYASTFNQQDPFYFLKLEAGKPPAVSGIVKLQGYPLYLHPLNEEQTMLVGIGHNTTGTGVNVANSGPMITVFDVSEGSTPKVLGSYMLPGSMSFQTEYDPKSLEYYDGKLVLAASGDDSALNWAMDGGANYTEAYNGYMPYTYFEGFIVFDLQKPAAIKELFRVRHSAQSGECYYCSSFTLSLYRSFSFDDGSLVTLYGNKVISTNLTSGKEIWMVEPHDEGATKDCCW